MASKTVKSDILRCLLRLEVSKGHLRWKVSELARLSKVSRPLIYYHFGNTKAAMVVTSVRMLAEEYFGLNEARIRMFLEGGTLDSLLWTRKRLQAFPEAIAFYFTWRKSNHPIRKQLVDIEREYQKMLHDGFRTFSSREIVAIHGLFFGVVTAPFLTDDSVRVATDLIGNLKRAGTDRTLGQATTGIGDGSPTLRERERPTTRGAATETARRKR